jgi:hypothetical protein
MIPGSPPLQVLAFFAVRIDASPRTAARSPVETEKANMVPGAKVLEPPFDRQLSSVCAKWMRMSCQIQMTDANGRCNAHPRSKQVRIAKVRRMDASGRQRKKEREKERKKEREKEREKGGKGEKGRMPGGIPKRAGKRKKKGKHVRFERHV